MEIIINNKTYILKSFNYIRRGHFINNVLSFYGDNLEKTQEFYNTYQHHLLKCIWLFIKDEDKKDIGTLEKLEVSQEQQGNFVNYCNDKITKYAEYIQEQSTNGAEKVDSYENIFAYLSKNYGWTFDYINEMDEIDLSNAIKEAINLNKKELLKDVNIQSLTGAFSQGSKQAKKQIDKMNKENEREEMEKRQSKEPPKEQVLSYQQMFGN